MERKSVGKFLVYFYPELDGSYSAFSPDFGQATGGSSRAQAERMAGDLVNGLLDLKEYQHLEDRKNRKKHCDVDPDKLYLEFTGEELSKEAKKGVYYKYIRPEIYYIYE